MSDSKTSRLVGVLRQEIAAGQHRPGHAIPSERQLSDSFVYSRTTIRRAIDQLVAEGLLVRRAGAGTFVAAPATAFGRARAKQGTKPFAIAFIIPTFSDPAYGEMVDGIEQEARGFGLQVIAGQSNYDPGLESDLLAKHAADRTVSGAILVPAKIDTALAGAQHFMAQGKPLTYLGRWPKAVSTDCISADYRAGAMLAVDHLIQNGHRRIAFADGLPHLSGFSPRDGYLEALRAASLPVEQDLLQELDLPLAEAGLEAVRNLQKARTVFSAVFARNDVTAIGVVRGLKEAGLRIPDDVSVVSMNNSQLAQHMEPSLTSVDSFPIILGRQAFQLVQERISGHYDGPPRRLHLQPSLVVRRSSSTAPARAQPETMSQSEQVSPRLGGVSA